MAHQPADATSAFAELGRIKLGETDLDGVLTQVARLARDTLPGAGEVSITLVRGEKAATAAATGETAVLLDALQYAERAGPCLLAAAGESTVSVPDTAAETRWPAWAGHATEAGAGSVLSVGLPILDDVTGSLNIYGAAPNAFDDEAVRLAQAFAGYAAVALGNAHLYDSTANLAEHLRTAMESRAVIEQAKGILMGERRCTADEAFAMLTKVSQDSNRKLRDVAATLVAQVQSGGRCR
jgi:GAF domain-containing protein